MIKSIIFLLTGIFFLWLGSDFVVESARNLAKKFKISHALVGLTIISIGTSLPEIFTNIFSGIKKLSGINASGIAVGTNIGSDVTQITLILGLTALIGTMYTTKHTVRRDGLMILVSIIAMFIMGFDGVITRLEGVILFFSYIIYLIYISREAHLLKKINREIHNRHSRHKIKTTNQLCIFIIGLALLIFGTKLVVENAIFLADKLGLAQSFIGIMIIGVGTGLPELSTAIRGVLRNAQGISLGTLIGSNITDPLFSLGSGAMIAGFNFDKNLIYFDLPFWFLASIVALYLIHKKMKIGKEDRKEGLILIFLYIIFVIIKIKFFR
jgi:cation:H+ antiporter